MKRPEKEGTFINLEAIIEAEGKLRSLYHKLGQFNDGVADLIIEWWDITSNLPSLISLSSMVKDTEMR